MTPRPKKFHVDCFTGYQAATWLEKNGEDPFAVWVSFAGPHAPYAPPEEMADLYYDAPIPEPYGSAAELASKPPAQHGRNRGSLDNSMFRIDPSLSTPEQYRRSRFVNIGLCSARTKERLPQADDPSIGMNPHPKKIGEFVKAYGLDTRDFHFQVGSFQ